MQTLEIGDVHFLYRPRVAQEQSDPPGDVQDFYVVLRPRGADRLRLLRMSGERLPDTDGHERLSGFVQSVASGPEGLRAELGGGKDDTGTSGRRQPAAEPAGRGVYAIVGRDADTFLIYILKLPLEGADARKEVLGIPPQARYVLSVKNPDADAPSQAGLSPDERPVFPPRLRQRFGDREWIGADPVELLDYRGAELLLVGAREDVDAGGTLPLKPHDQAEVLRRLALDHDEDGVAALFEHDWA